VVQRRYDTTLGAFLFVKRHKHTVCFVAYMAETLGDRIRDARVALGFGVRGLAGQLGVSPSYISDIENDRRVPSEAVLRAIGERLDLDFDELMALAGRFGEDADRYMRRTPAAGALFRRLTEQKVPNEEIEELMRRFLRDDTGGS